MEKVGLKEGKFLCLISPMFISNKTYLPRDYNLIEVAFRIEPGFSRVKSKQTF